jgi:hypothetical protein
MGSMTELAAWAAVNRGMLAVVRAGWMRVVAWLVEWQVAAIPDERVLGRWHRREGVLGGRVSGRPLVDALVTALEAVAVALAFCPRRRWPAFPVRWRYVAGEAGGTLGSGAGDSGTLGTGSGLVGAGKGGETSGTLGIGSGLVDAGRGAKPRGTSGVGAKFW